MKKEFLYHKVPKNMQGTTLYPLNELKKQHPDVYNEQVKKYEGREALLESKIPTLSCLWNDVLHFTAVHPKIVKDAMSQLGQKYTGKFFQIDPHSLEPENTTVYLYEPPQTWQPLEKSDFVSYDPEKVSGYSIFRKETIEDYKKRIADGKKPMVNVFVPHILYRGAIDVGGVKVIEV